MQFFKGQQTEPYYFIGTNFWYGPILGSTGQGGNRTRLCAELDSLKALGVNNLRILAGADAGSKHANTVKPYLQAKPGELNDTLLVGLDYMLAEMAKRDMVAVIYLTNSWDWSGGYGFICAKQATVIRPTLTARATTIMWSMPASSFTTKRRNNCS